MGYIVDRFEEQFAVLECENGTMLNVTKDSLPLEVKEGDVLIYDNNRYVIDQNATEYRKQQMDDLFQSLF